MGEEGYKSNLPTSKIKLHIHTSMDVDKSKDVGFSTVTTYNKRKCRETVYWDEEEIEALKKGVEKHGEGRWRVIYDDFRDSFKPKRRLGDLSDKWRLINRKTSYRRTKAHKFFLLDENYNHVCNAIGEPIYYSAKFAHEAAVKSTRARVQIGNKEEKIIYLLEESNNEKTVHKYKTFVDEGDKPKASKISSDSITK